MKDGRFVARRVQYFVVGGHGTARRARDAGIVTGTPGASGTPGPALLLELAGAPKLVEVEVRVGRLRVVLGRKFEDQRSTGRLGQRLAESRTPLLADRHLLLEAR